MVPYSPEQHGPITLDGRKVSRDPCTPQYTAPYFLPEALRVGLPRILYSEPWVKVEDRLQVFIARVFIAGMRLHTSPLYAPAPVPRRCGQTPSAAWPSSRARRSAP